MEFVPTFFLGGLSCLDFCNTFDHHHSSPAYDFIPDRATLLRWGQAAGILPEDLQNGNSNDQEAFAEALRARLLIFQLFEPFSRSDRPADAVLAAFNSLLQETASRMNIVRTGQRYVLAYPAEDPLEKLIGEVVQSAADLLISKQAVQVKQCAGCGWLFYDSTRNRSRRWCDMRVCGNKAKARRHYERVKQKRKGSA